MKAVTIQEAQARLRELIMQMQPGEQLAITENGIQIAILTRIGDLPQNE